MSKWFVGSSNKIKLEGTTSILASASLAFSPPERTFTNFSISSPVNIKLPKYVLESVSLQPFVTFLNES